MCYLNPSAELLGPTPLPFSFQTTTPQVLNPIDASDAQKSLTKSKAPVPRLTALINVY